jgi:hypothetical protein
LTEKGFYPSKVHLAATERRLDIVLNLLFTDLARCVPDIEGARCVHLGIVCQFCGLVIDLARMLTPCNLDITLGSGQAKISAGEVKETLGVIRADKGHGATSRDAGYLGN